MRPQSLRPATAKAATSRKMVTHLSKGEQHHRKRLSEVGCVSDCAQVLSQVFDDAERRDPGQHRTWVALVDGNNHQLARVHAEAQARGVQVTIVVDFVHVLEYLWRADWCCFAEGDSTPRPGSTTTPG